MLFYTTISAFMGLLLILENLGCFTVRQSKKIGYVILFFFFVISCIRWGCGTDWDTYHSYFMSGGSIEAGWDGNFEIGYRIVIFIVRQFTDNYVLMNTIWATSVFLFSIILIKQVESRICFNDSNKVNDASLYQYSSILSVICCMWFLYFGNIFFTRSTLAIIMLVVSIKYAENKQFMKFVLIVLLATIFHRTSIVFLIVYPIVNSKRFLFRYFHWISAILFFFFYFWGKKFIYSISFFLPAAVQYKLMIYSKEILDVGISGIINILFLWGIFLLVYYCLDKDNKELIDLIKIYSVALIPYAVGVSFNGYFIRMAYPYMAVQVLLIPKCLQKIKGNGGRVIASVVIIIYLYLRLRLNLSSYDVFIPFKTIFSSQ